MKFRIIMMLAFLHGILITYSAEALIIQTKPYLVSYSNQTDLKSKYKAVQKAKRFVLRECAMKGCTDCSVYATDSYYDDYIEKYVGEAWASGCHN